METSAKNSHNVEQSFQMMASEIKQKIASQPKATGGMNLGGQNVRPGAPRVARVRPPSFSLWSIGEGWEGTPADWTDYICLTIAFFSLVLWLHQKNPSYLTEPVNWERIHQDESSGGGAEEGADEVEEVVEEEEKTSAEGKKVK
eukprot:g15185.t1